jgi:cyclohexa-1,5-dienecarbonyl-CoA hydratase
MSAAPAKNSPLKTWFEQDETLLRIRLSAPKANIIDAAMVAELRQAFDQLQGKNQLRAVLLDAEGPHFSFGASVEEHLPEQCAAMLKSFHALLLQMLSVTVPILVVIRGQCLGGGLELACAGSQIFANPEAKMGQPEIVLGVIAPAASCLLPIRIGQARAEDLLLSGRIIDTFESQNRGLTQEISDDPEASALNYFKTHLKPKSASSLRFALQASRKGLIDEMKAKLAAVEELYLHELMKTNDAVEGLNAFLEKRSPQWEN